MLEVRYNESTKELTGWCGDKRQFGNLARPRCKVAILNIPIPDKPIEALLYDEATQNLVDNPDYVEPEPDRDLEAEIEKLKGATNGT